MDWPRTAPGYLVHPVLLIVLDIIALAFAARVNIFQEFYCECFILFS